MWLFLDLNSYFASVEQQLRPELRNRPVAVVPTMADSTCCIAASYEAKAFGIRTGTRVSDAKKMCPELVLISGNHEVYIQYHKRIVETVESCAPVSAVLSIDEMACELIGRECDNAIAIAKKIKQTIYSEVGEYLSCSIGLAPNRFLAKVASDMQKPDGLTHLKLEDLPQKILHLRPRDLPGIGPRMEERLHSHGIRTMEQLWNCNDKALRQVWGGINGERFWHCLHGHQLADIPIRSKSLSHEHVLEPDLRTHNGAYAVAQKLLHKGAARLRKLGYWCSELQVAIKFADWNSTVPYWSAKSRILECQDNLTLLEALQALWAQAPRRKPLKVSVYFTELIPNELHNLSFFDNPKRSQLVASIDKINAKFGRNTIYFAGVHNIQQAAPTRIAFQSIPDIS